MFVTVILNYFTFNRRMSENEEEDVTPEQTDLIVQYSAATGNDDLDACTNALKVSLSVQHISVYSMAFVRPICILYISRITNGTYQAQLQRRWQHRIQLQRVPPALNLLKAARMNRSTCLGKDYDAETRSMFPYRQPKHHHQLNYLPHLNG